MNSASIRRLALQLHATGTAQSLVIEKHANAMAGHASNILKIASKTQSAIGALAVSSSMQAEVHSKQANEINQNLNAMEQNMRHMTLKTERGTAVVRRQAAFITRHAKTLFNLMQDIRKLFILCISLSNNKIHQLTYSQSNKVLEGNARGNQQKHVRFPN
jgi:beta-mannanase